MDPLKDPRLSLRARGLYLTYRSLGEVISATEMQKIVPEGRDAIRKAMSELIEFGYIESVHYQTAYGHWYTLYRFTEAWKTEDGFSGPLYSCSSYIANSDKALAVFPNGNTSSASGAPKEEEVMGWKDWEDEPTGAVGKLPEDKRAMRQAKYAKHKAPDVSRFEIPEEEWTTNHLLGEFYALTDQHAKGAPSQVNARNLASWINRQVGLGVPRVAILEAMRMFFNDPRLVRDPGVGQPFWRRFVAFYPTVHGLVVPPVDNDYGDQQTTAKTLKLLEG